MSTTLVPPTARQLQQEVERRRNLLALHWKNCRQCSKNTELLRVRNLCLIGRLHRLAYIESQICESLQMEADRPAMLFGYPVR